MSDKKQKALLFTEYKKPPVFGEADVEEPKEGQVQIKVIASTVNPSDRIRSYGGQGGYFVTPVPYVGGIEGYGEVVKAGCDKGKDLVGKKVSFFAKNGAWREYATADVHAAWPLDEDVPVHCGACGLVNPLTVLGFVDVFRRWNKDSKDKHGIIHTAAASALGRMLNKLCQKEGIPLLNIVRRQEQAELLKKEGAQHVIVTGTEGWLDLYKAAIKEHGFNVLFDALGGGQVTTQLIENLEERSEAHLYGKLVTEPLKINNSFALMKGVHITGFILFVWMRSLKMEEIGAMRKQLSNHLKGPLATNMAKKVTFEEFPEQWHESEKKATDGKYCIVPSA